MGNKTVSAEIEAAYNIDAAMDDERYKAGYEDSVENPIAQLILSYILFGAAGYGIGIAFIWIVLSLRGALL